MTIIDLTKTSIMLMPLLEYMKYVSERDKKEYTDLTEFISTLKFKHIYADTPENVLPFIMDDDYFVCASNENTSSIIEDAITFMLKHENLKGLKRLSMKDEYEAKYLNCKRLYVDNQPYVEE